jgi:hypothetical protein
MSRLKIIAVAILLLACIPLVASASASMVSTGSVTDGRIQASTTLMSTQHNDILTINGANSNVRGIGYIAYTNAIETNGSFMNTAYLAQINTGRMIGSASNSVLVSTPPSEVSICSGGACGEDCIPATYSNIATMSDFDITGGYVQSYTDIGGPSVTSVVDGNARGTIGSYASWIDMNGGCPNVNDESGSSRFRVSGITAQITTRFIHG